MAGYVIHLAVAKQFLKKHPEYNKKEFLKGVIAPDLVENKEKTHFSKSSQNCNLESFLSMHTLDKGYYSGWYLHLITDILFYKEYLGNWDNLEGVSSIKLYDDYDITNKYLIDMYNIEIAEEIKTDIYYKQGELTYIDKSTIVEFIEKVSSINLEQYK